jgi:GNAT superfamily N-acetyltransferase
MTTVQARAAVTYRIATIDDVPRLVAMGCAQLAAVYADTMPAHPQHLDALIRQVLQTPACAVFVAEQAELVVGMIVMTLYRHPQSGLMTAGEVAWWMDPGARGHGRALLARAERWALENGAEQVQMVAPATQERLGLLYTRRGYVPLETTYQAPVTPAMSALAVHDDVVPDLAAYRTAIRAQPFRTVEPHPGAIFHGIGEAGNDLLPNWIVAHYPTLTPTLTFVRQSPAGQEEPHFIHTDQDMGEWTAIAYLTDEPQAGDGTTFWRWRQTGCVRSLATTTDEQLTEWTAWRDVTQWEAWTTVRARPNRVVLFPAAYFHSRAIAENYGAGETSRLIQVVFGTGTFPPESRQ